MKLFTVFIAIIIGCQGVSATTNPVLCSQVDYLFYNSDCCNAAAEVPCMEQLAKVTYDATVTDLYAKIENVKTGGLAIAASRALDIQDGASLNVHGSGVGQDANGNDKFGTLLVKQYGTLDFEAGAVLDLSKISLDAGKDANTRAKLAFSELGDVTGDVTFNGVVNADKGISVDAGQFSVADVTGNVVTKGSLEAYGKATASALDINGKVRIESNGDFRSAASVAMEDDLLVIDTSCANPPCVDHQFKVKQADGEVEAKGNVFVRQALEVDGLSKLDGGINVANLFTVGADGTTTVDALVTMKKLVTMKGGGRLEGSWVVPTGSAISVLGTLNIEQGNLKTTGTVSSTGITFDTLTAPADFNDQAVTNVNFDSGSISGVTIDGSAIGATTASTVKATTVDASSTITGAGDLSIAGTATVSAVTVNAGAVSGVTTLAVADITVSNDMTVQGNAAITGTLAAGVSTLAATTAASVEVTGASTLKGAAMLEGDVTIKKEAIFEEGLQVGVGGTTTGHFSSGGDGFQCDSEAVVFNSINADATSGSSAPTLEQCAKVAEIVLNSNGYYCNSKPLLTATDGENCPAGWNQGTQVTGFTGYFTHESASGRCKLCTGDASKAGAGYHHYKYGTVTSGAVDFAKDGTLQTSGKATLDSMEVTNAGTVKDLTVSNTLVLDGTTTTTNGFTLTSEGDVSINSVVVSTTLDVSGAVKLSGAQTSTALASFEAGLKTVGGSCNDDSKTKLQCAGDTCTVDAVAAQTCVWTSVDGVSALIDGSIEAKTVKLTDAAANALNVEKSNHCSNAAYATEATCEAAGNVWTALKNVASISNDGTLTATKVESAGRIMPMYQQTNDAGLHCSDNDGVIIQVVGACTAGLNFRQWSCDDSGSDISFGDFGGSPHADNWMGTCTGTYTATYVAACSRYDGTGQPDDTNNKKFCEPLHTKAQCLGTELILRGKYYAVPDVEASMAGVAAKAWTATGAVNMKVCVSGGVV
jgi:hypothetical protein